MKSIIMADRPVLSKLMNESTDTGNDLGRLSKEVLETLWYDEMASDNEIAEALGVQAKDVTEKRRSYGINRMAELVHNRMKFSILGTAGSAIMML